MERSWNQVGIDAREKYDELSHNGWDWSSFYNGYLEGTEAERKATKPLDLGSVVEAFTSLVNLCDNLANLGYVHKDDGLPISFSSDGALEKARQSILTLRSTVTPAPVAKVVVDLSREHLAKWIRRTIVPGTGNLFGQTAGDELPEAIADTVLTLLARLPGVDVRGV